LLNLSFNWLIHPIHECNILKCFSKEHIISSSIVVQFQVGYIVAMEQFKELGPDCFVLSFLFIITFNIILPQFNTPFNVKNSKQNYTNFNIFKINLMKF
jgi:hypothetical protein